MQFNEKANRFIEEATTFLEDALKNGRISQKPKIALDNRDNLIIFEDCEDEIYSYIKALAIKYEYCHRIWLSGENITVYFDDTSIFGNLQRAVLFLKDFNQRDLFRLAKESELRIKQEIPKQVIEKFLMRGMSNEDFFTSDFLPNNGYDISSLFHNEPPADRIIISPPNS